MEISLTLLSCSYSTENFPDIVKTVTVGLEMIAREKEQQIRIACWKLFEDSFSNFGQKILETNPTILTPMRDILLISFKEFV
jgi:hypothetical protein